MNNRGQVVIYAFMLGLVVLVLALGLAPSVAESTNNTMGNSTTNDSVYVFNQTVIDLKGVNNGSLSGNANISSSGKLGLGGVTLDGNGDYVNVTNQSINYHNLTISAWIYPKSGSDTPTFEYIVQSNLNTRTRLVYDSTLQRGAAQAGNPATQITASTNSMPLNQWSHVAISVYTINATSGNLTYYVNGNIINTSIFSDTTTAGSAFIIGSFSAPSSYFNGSIDDIMLFSNQLNASAILNIYNQNSAGDRVYTSHPNLVSYWTFDDGQMVNFGILTGLDCENASITDFTKAACYATDLTLFVFIGFLIMMAGAILTSKIIFG